ncbi:hypothetical protein M673_09015 [Aureimonas sp. AU20]|nr:hypothetical protein M673_09015 [Aureimonas sp. AU20]
MRDSGELIEHGRMTFLWSDSALLQIQISGSAG